MIESANDDSKKKKCVTTLKHSPKQLSTNSLSVTKKKQIKVLIHQNS